MFRKFDKQHISKRNLMRGSDFKAVKKYIAANYNFTDQQLDELLPKKTSPSVLKMVNKTCIISADDRYIAIGINDDVYIPTLRVVHKCKLLYYLSESILTLRILQIPK